MTQLSLIDPSALSQASAGIALDLRSPDSYWQGHLPNARQVDAALFALPKTDAASVQQYEARLRWLFSTLGLNADAPMLVYGENFDGSVARAAWALAFAGVKRVSVLAGPLALAEGVPLSREAPVFAAQSFALSPQRALLATADDIAATLGNAGTRIVDAREADDYRGTKAATKAGTNAGTKPGAGHIPGALHWDNRQELNAAGTLETPDALAERFGALGLAKHEPIVVYCGGGPRASRTWLALQRAGYTRASVYQSSWGEWGARADLPVETSAN